MRTFVRMVCILACLVVLPTVCFAETQEEWNLSCNYKTSKSVEMYQYPNCQGNYLGILPANTYVKVQKTMDGFKGVSWMRDGRSGYGWVDSSAIVRCSSQYRQSNGMAENVHELDPNHDKILSEHDVILVAPSLLQNGEQDYSGLDYEQPDPIPLPNATAVPAEMQSVPKGMGTASVSSGKKDTSDKHEETNDAAVLISLVKLGIHTSVVQHQGHEVEVPTTELQFSATVPEGKRIASILAPRTGRCYLRTKASSKADIMDKCKAGTIVQVIKYGKSYCQIVYEGQVGYVQTACLTFLDPAVTIMGTTVLTYNGKATGNAQVPIRNTANNDSAIVIKARSGTVVTVLGKSGKWYEVELEGMHGYVHQNFINSNEILK